MKLVFLSSQPSPQDQSRSTRSVLLISERNARHVIGVLRYLRRTNALLPPELLTFAQGVQVVHEDQKMDRPLCSYLKSFGVCRSPFSHFQMMIRYLNNNDSTV